jgi:hypothetical protein
MREVILEIFSAIARIAEIDATTRTSLFSDVDLSSLLAMVLQVYEPLAA